jgi:hypothetical protein
MLYLIIAFCLSINAYKFAIVICAIGCGHSMYKLGKRELEKRKALDD